MSVGRAARSDCRTACPVMPLRGYPVMPRFALVSDLRTIAPVSVSAAQADAFYREVIEHGSVWSVRDQSGFPAPETPEGRAMPFWSLRSRAEGVVTGLPAYARLEVELSLDEWRSRWLPGLQRDEMRVGLNWSGGRATGFHLMPETSRPISLRAKPSREHPVMPLRGHPMPLRAGSARCVQGGAEGRRCRTESPRSRETLRSHAGPLECPAGRSLRSCSGCSQV